MLHGREDTVEYRLWPPVAIGAPLLVGWLVTVAWGDPVELGGRRVPFGWALVTFFHCFTGGTKTLALTSPGKGTPVALPKPKRVM